MIALSSNFTVQLPFLCFSELIFSRQNPTDFFPLQNFIIVLMDRGIPEFNKVVTRRQILLSKAMHREKLRNATKAVDNELPDSVYHPINKRNKEHAIEGKFVRKIKMVRKMHSN
jgi:hypothetical protein